MNVCKIEHFSKIYQTEVEYDNATYTVRWCETCGIIQITRAWRAYNKLIEPGTGEWFRVQAKFMALAKGKGDG